MRREYQRRGSSLAESNLAEGGFDEFHPVLNEQRVIMPTVAEIYGRGIAGEVGTGSAGSALPPVS